MNKKTFGLVAIVVGGIFAVVSLTMAFIDLDTGQRINSPQLIFATVGLWVFLAGIWLRRAKQKEKE